MLTNSFRTHKNCFHSVTYVLITLFFLPSISYGQSNPLTLNSAVSQALSQSLEAKRAALKLEQAKINAAVVDASNDPSLGLSGAWGARWQKRTDNSPPSFEERSTIHSYGLQMRYNLIDFGRQNSKELSASSQLKLQDLAKEEADEKIFWSVVRAYQDISTSERILEITREQKTISENRLSEQNKNYRQGLRPESDVVTAEVDVGKAKIALQNSLNQVFLAKQALAQLINSENPNPSLDFSVIKGNVTAVSPTYWDSLIKEIEQKSPPATTSQKIISASREALSADEHAIDASTKPVLGTLISAEYSGEGDWSPLRPAASGQLQLTWDIPWNGMSRLSRQSLAINKQDLDLREKSIQQSMRQNEIHARTLFSQTKILHESMQGQAKLVSRQYQLVQNRYQVGQASALDLSAAENALVILKLDQVRLSSNIAGAIIDLAEARGVRALEILEKL